MIANQYIKKGYVEEIDIDESFQNNKVVYNIDATLSVSGVSYDCQIALDINGNVHAYGCDCYYCTNKIACAHIGALLLMLSNINPDAYPYRWVSERKKQREAFEEQLKMRQINELLSDYQDLTKKELTPVQSINKVKIIPTYTEYGITYKLGCEKLYVLKNIPQFLNDIDRENTVSYGKMLMFKHTIDVFDDFSIKQIEFMRLGVDYQLKDKILLNNHTIDMFYDLYKDKNYDRLPQLIDQNYCLKINVVRTQSSFELEITNEEDFFYLPGKVHGYVFVEDKIERFDLAMSKKIHKFLSRILVEKIVIPHAKMEQFYTYVYRNIEKYCEFTGDSFDEFKTQEERIAIYVERYDEYQISARVTFDHYEEGIVEGIDDNNTPNTLSVKEELVINCMKQYADVIDYDVHLAYFNDGENSMFSFLKEGVAFLSRFCDVFISDELKHMEIKQDAQFKVGVHLNVDLLEVDVQSIDVAPEEIYQILLSYKQKKKYHRLKKGGFLDLEGDNVKKMSDLLDNFHFDEKDLKKGLLQLPMYRASYVNTLLNDEQMEASRNQNFQDLIANMQHVDQQNFEIPDTLHAELRDYQKFGFQWLKTMSKYGFGGILADDMGLGKTIQMITLFEDIKKETPTASNLVVCPASLILNWKDEVHKFSDDLQVLCIQGSKTERNALIAIAGTYDVVVTSYDYLRKDIKQYEATRFHTVVIDEAQYIKNQNTKNATSVKALHAKQRFALTGTPIENSLAELWSIFDFLMPGYLFHYAYFAKNFETKIVKQQDKEVLSKLSKMVAPFILRRIKKDVLKELPDKMENVLKMSFSEEEEKLYIANLAMVNKELNEKLQIEGLSKSKILILAMMTRLRQLCCDSRLLYDNVKSTSTKMQACVDLIITAKEEGKKVLLFSSFTSVLDLIEIELKKENISYYMLTGSTDKLKRHELVDQFQEDDTSVFLISLKAGGTGLNLTSAEIVIHYDPWWNQSAQNQATDRAHRIGQTQTVSEYKLIMENSIEEKIQELQKKKFDLSNAIISGNEGGITHMSKEEIMSLFEHDKKN